MSTTELIERTTASTRTLDTRGLLCPYPFIQAKEVLEALPRGSSVEVLTDSGPTATSSIPVLCEKNGYAYSAEQDGDLWRLVIHKP